MDWLYNLTINSSDVNLQIQTLRNPVFDAFFLLLTFLGNEEFYLLVVPFFYWVVHKEFGRALIYLLTISNSVNAFFKNWLDFPRPYQVNAKVIAIAGEGTTQATNYGLPSAHAQLAVTLWGYAAWTFRQRVPRQLGRWLVPGAVLLALLVGFSRLYLGVHFLTDVLVGWGLGIIVLVLWVNYEATWLRLLGQLSQNLIIILAIAIPLIYFFIVPDGPDGYPAEDAATNGGILLGINLGFFYESQRTRFSVAGPWQQRWLRYLAGIILVVLCWGGLRVIFGAIETSYQIEMVLRFIRFACTGLTMTWFAPALFVRLGLAEQEKN